MLPSTSYNINLNATSVPLRARKSCNYQLDEAAYTCYGEKPALKVEMSTSMSENPQPVYEGGCSTTRTHRMTDSIHNSECSGQCPIFSRIHRECPRNSAIGNRTHPRMETENQPENEPRQILKTLIQIVNLIFTFVFSRRDDL